MTPRTILLAWAESGGFAATHGAGATNEAIVDDLLAFLAREGVAIVPREPTEAMIVGGLKEERGMTAPKTLTRIWRAMMGTAS